MNLSVFGLGIIGEIWARNLAADGHQVVGWNRTPKNLPFYTGDAHAAAASAELLIIAVADPPAVQNVLDRIRPALRRGQIVVQSSTVSPSATLDFARQVRATGAEFLEAPFTGSRPAALERKTVFFIGDDHDVLPRARPVLERLGAKILPVGPIGSASALKLALNVNNAVIAQGLGESLALARGAGIPDEIFFHALKLGVGRSGLSDLKEPKLRAGDFTAQFSVKHMAKDLRLALEMGGDLPLGVTRAVLGVYDDGIRRGWQDDDFIGLFRHLVPGRPTERT
jgi:3-hydroxyisobutyrate dehydrogenase-like beta-hydroxyacid dehydrogenase